MRARFVGLAALVAGCAVLVAGCAGTPAPAPRAAGPAPVTTLEGLDVSAGLDPFPIECAGPPEGSLEEREVIARERWARAAADAEADRTDDALAGFVEAYCVMEGHPARASMLHTIAGFLQDLGRYRAAYETMRRAIAEGGEPPFDGFAGYRTFYLRAVLRASVERLEADEEPFELCGANDRPGCEDGAECLRDYVRFNDGLCPTLVQLDQSCPGVCVPTRIVREEGE